MFGGYQKVVQITVIVIVIGSHEITLQSRESEKQENVEIEKEEQANFASGDMN